MKSQNGQNIPLPGMPTETSGVDGAQAQGRHAYTMRDKVVIGVWNGNGAFTSSAAQQALMTALLGKFAYYEVQGNATLATMWTGAQSTPFTAENAATINKRTGGYKSQRMLSMTWDGYNARQSGGPQLRGGAMAGDPRPAKAARLSPPEYFQQYNFDDQGRVLDECSVHALNSTLVNCLGKQPVQKWSESGIPREVVTGYRKLKSGKMRALMAQCHGWTTKTAVLLVHVVFCWSMKPACWSTVGFCCNSPAASQPCLRVVPHGW